MSSKNKARNIHACHPIMRKGGPHEKSKGAKRAAAKRETRRKTGEWLGRQPSHHPLQNPQRIDLLHFFKFATLQYRLQA